MNFSMKESQRYFPPTAGKEGIQNQCPGKKTSYDIKREGLFSSLTGCLRRGVVLRIEGLLQ